MEIEKGLNVVSTGEAHCLFELFQFVGDFIIPAALANLE